MHYTNRFTCIGSCVIALHITFSIFCFIPFLLFSRAIALRSAHIFTTRNRPSTVAITTLHIQHVKCFKAKFCFHSLQSIFLFILMNQFICILTFLIISSISSGCLAFPFSFYLAVFAPSSAIHSVFVV